MQEQSTDKKLAEISAAAGQADRAFRQIVARLSAIYEEKTGRIVPDCMSDFDVQLRRATDPEFARLTRQICEFRALILGI